MTLLSNCTPRSNILPTPTYVIRKATETDSGKLVEFFLHHPEVALCEWQDSKVMENLLRQQNTVCYLAKTDTQEFIGAVIGGVIGTRGTVSHLAVSQDWRMQGVASALVEKMFAHFNAFSTRRVFLFIHNENHSARQFWTRLGFQQRSNEITCEIDL